MRNLSLHRLGLLLRSIWQANRKDAAIALAVFLLLMTIALWYGLTDPLGLHDDALLLRHTDLVRSFLCAALVFSAIVRVFHNIKRRPGFQQFMLLPASHLEKYLSRLLAFVVLWIPVCSVAEDLPYLLWALLGRTFSPAVSDKALEWLARSYSYGDMTTLDIAMSMLAACWVVSVFVVSAARHARHSGVRALLAIALLTMGGAFCAGFLMGYLNGNGYDGDLGDLAVACHVQLWGPVLLIAVTLANLVWGYRCFCRRQLTGTL